MDFKYEGWLPHLIDAIPIAARKNHTSLYTIALEGWRRGLKVKFFIDQDNRIGCSLIHDGKAYDFVGSSGPLITEEIIEICDDKGITNGYLSKAGVPIPMGREFEEGDSDDEILRYAWEVKYPLVLKPTDGKAGRGVYAGINNEMELKYAIKAVRENLGYKNILLQQFVTGDEVRIYVLDGRVLAASNRRPANIIGDGVSTVKKLITEKNLLRKKVPSLYFRPIKLDKEIHTAVKQRGYTMESIPKKGERIYLRKISNLSRGGESVDITEQLTAEQKHIAVNAAKAIPGLVQAGVDMIIDDNTGSGVILEINTRPGIGNHLFPVEGKASDIPKEIVDFYIPETKGIVTNDSNVYFEFREILETLKGKFIEEVELQDYPGKLQSKRFITSGITDITRFYRRVEESVYEKNLHGFLKHLDDKVEIIVGSASEKAMDVFSKDLYNVADQLGISISEDEEYHQPVLLGFRLLEESSDMSVRQLKKKNRELREKERAVEKEKIRINKRMNLIQNSRAWKMTYPIRSITARIKSVGKKIN